PVLRSARRTARRDSTGPGMPGRRGRRARARPSCRRADGPWGQQPSCPPLWGYEVMGGKSSGRTLSGPRPARPGGASEVFVRLERVIAARLLDVLLVLVLLVYLGEGWRNGILRSVSAILGVAAGGVAAFFAVPLLAAAIPSPDWRIGVSIALSVLLLVGGHLLGVTIGSALRGRHPENPRAERDLSTAERLLGGVANLVAAALVTTLVAGSVAQLGVPVLSQAVKRSIVISTIDRLTPTPIAEGIARVRATILEYEIPTIDENLGGVAQGQNPPQVDTSTNPLADAARSVARISGTAYACGQNQSGSGFVVAPERVVTNAHVVAGVDSPIVELP